MTKLITAVFAIGIIIAIALLGYHAVAWVGGAYSNLETNTAAFLVVAATALLLCSMIIASALRSLGQDRIAAQRWSAKAEAYALCLELLQNPDRDPASETHRLSERRLALHAGQNVLRHYRVIRETTSESPRGESIPVMDPLLQAMRQDLGEATFGIAKGSLNSLLIRAPDRRSEAERSE